MFQAHVRAQVSKVFSSSRGQLDHELNEKCWAR
jgi:hypothetical protein